MLHDLDNTIVQVLKGGLPPDLADVSFSFASPAHDFPPSSLAFPVINLFLYKAGTDLSLRENAPYLQRAKDGTVLRRRPPCYIECSYLVSVWPNPSGTDPANEEHRIFGEVLRVLLANPLLPASILQNSLANTQTLPVTAKIADVGLQTGSTVWQSLGTCSRLSLVYSLTVSMQLYDSEAVPVVTEKQLRMRRLENEVPQ